jgi:hypothetical protein
MTFIIMIAVGEPGWRLIQKKAWQTETRQACAGHSAFRRFAIS